MDKLRLLENYVEGGEATIRVNKPIVNSWNEEGITAAEFCSHLDYLVNTGASKITVAINSTGGSMFAGLEMYTAIKDCPVSICTKVVGVAASIAGVISQAGDNRVIMQHAIYHAHSPRPAKGAKVGQELLDLSYDSLKGLFMRSTGQSEEAVEEMLNKETFLSADEAKAFGLFDEVEADERQGVAVEGMEAAAVMEVFNKLEHKVNKMQKVNAILSLSNDANEAATLEAVNGLKAEASKVPALEAKVEELENALNVANKAKAEALVNQAVEAGKITEEAAPMWVENAVTNYEGTKSMLEGITTAPKAVTNAAAADVTKVINSNDANVENRKEWGYLEWSKNDPAGLKNLKNSNPAEFEKLLNEYAG